MRQRNGLRLLAVGFSACLLIGRAGGALGQGRHVDPDRAQEEAAREGAHLGANEAKRLERQLAAHPNDLIVRARLAGYYMMNNGGAARVQNILWLYRHAPAARITGSPEAALDRVQDSSSIATARKIWIEQVRAHPRDIRVLSNAAEFYTMLFNPADSRQAERLYEQAEAIQPHNPELANRFGHLYELQLSDQTGAARQALARRALAQYEIWYRYEDPNERDGNYMGLTDMAKVAFEAGAYDKARRYATRMLDVAANSSDAGNLIHHGNLVLGRLALAAGEVEQAKRYLLAAGKTPGSPQLDSFGPNMLLAKELLEKGERQVVLDYFRLCGNFWQDPQLKQWTDEVSQGKMPDFGANLAY
jgi:ATP/maltotriose-dependent transcriptional regulator MalT